MAFNFLRLASPCSRLLLSLSTFSNSFAILTGIVALQPAADCYQVSRSGVKMTLWSSYKALSPKTRMFVGVGLMVNTAIAMHFEDQIEDLLSMKSTPEEQKKLQNELPKVSLVERGSK